MTDPTVAADAASRPVPGAVPSADEWQELVRLASPTEERNPRTTDVDLLPTADVVALITEEDAGVADAVRAQRDRIAEAVDLAVAALRAGGRVHYVGSGTSGRLGVLDAVELLPTYGVGEEWFVAHLAGGVGAMMLAVEGAEDDVSLGRADVDAVGPDDVVVGLAASGRTPYVRGALDVARERRARTVLVSANPAAPLAAGVDVAILVDTGPEVVTGSTRMKAATAQKLVLNTFSTATMIRLGKTYSNLMIDVRPTNQKLRARIVRMLVQATGLGAPECEEVLHSAGGEVHVALVMLLADADADAARAALGGDGAAGVRDALARLGALSAR
ncbi:N-acetylmuramic acid 6-phosphate etherase [Cellulosimicrobium cellulans]|uniref:N-acetylmuramic acid 6-phosphate etherase n=1 Tax=Cellulosimicrobium cellulans TaxID=1710 RepID=UPI002405C41D|nr:N-acetylmuramic acid 6-phosphate etherase [Cellulosimicrobium cellulans]MDF9876416.1 N-acetylmuramic acid 6-phosphate etherase [Cellulosimicrobium cellulans]